MQVLLSSFDLFKGVGGGQTFYRNLILRNPQIQFTYLRNSEPEDISRPENARAVPCLNRFLAPPEHLSIDLKVPRWLYGSFARANDVARAVAGQRFDVVDLPDYEQFGLFFRDAFDQYQVSVDRIVLGMHGRISTSIALNWGANRNDRLELTQLEDMQYQAVDARYFISAKYRDEWRDVDPVPAYILDPLRFFDIPRPQPCEDRAGPPDLHFIGRCERCKGPDIFVNLIWWLPRSSYRTANLIGPPSYDWDGTSSDTYLRQMIENRRLCGVNLARCMTPAELAQVFTSKTVTVIPSVYDTLNLVALESLLSGCPTAIGSGAGVCRYLRERFPGLPFEVIDVDNWFESVPRLEAMLNNYQDYRERLLDAIVAEDLQPCGPQLIDVYEAPPAFDPLLRRRITDWYDRLFRSLPMSRELFERHARCA